MNLDVLFEGDIDLPRLAEVLDGLGHVGRLDTILHWDHDKQRRLFEKCKGFKTLSFDDFVPSDVDPLVEVVHWGKNSLPALTHFQKRFCKPKPNGDNGGKKELWGYNEQAPDGVFPTKAFTGPGYYVMHEPEGRQDSEGELDIDYTRLPPAKPEAWPSIVPNERRAGRFVYAGMVDVMRGVSKHVSVGRAIKGGKFIDAYFVLCREDPKS